MNPSIPFLSKERNSVNHANYYYYTNAFTLEECIKIREVGDSYPKSKAYTGTETLSDYRISDISWILPNEESMWIFDKLSNYAIEANKIMWNFDIWGYLDNLQYTTYYGDGGHYDWHMDLGPEMSNRKLSCVLQLSDPGEYEGGDLEINIGSSIMKVPKQLGTLTFFPSFLLHRVTPLTGGVRISMVTWLCGANLR